VKLRKIATTAVTLALLAGGGWLLYERFGRTEAVKIEYRTAAAERGRVTATVTASGTLSPLKTVQVGSQVSGRILELYADFNSEVKKGDLLAKLDPSLIESDKTRARASLLSAQANLTRAIADRDNAKVVYDRTKSLADSKVVAAQDVEATLVAWKAAKANVESAQAAVSVARAAIETVDVNLTYTTIVSPIDGVVISRDVSVGQTVAASLSAPTLFTIAEDLKAMEVHTNVAESDVGMLKPEMSVRFTVDAYPSERFRGTVFQIRNAPQTVQNVVTYDAVVRVDNDQLKLRRA
jgi:HlyD family secretion protein